MAYPFRPVLACRFGSGEGASASIRTAVRQGGPSSATRTLKRLLRALAQGVLRCGRRLAASSDGLRSTCVEKLCFEGAANGSGPARAIAVLRTRRGTTHSPSFAYESLRGSQSDAGSHFVNGSAIETNSSPERNRVFQLEGTSPSRRDAEVARHRVPRSRLRSSICSERIKSDPPALLPFTKVPRNQGWKRPPKPWCVFDVIGIACRAASLDQGM